MSLLLVLLDLNAKNWSEHPESGYLEAPSSKSASSQDPCRLWDIVHDISILFSHQLTCSASAKIGLIVYDESGAEVLFPDASNARHSEIISQFDLEGLNEAIVKLIVGYLGSKKTISSVSRASALDEALFKALLVSSSFKKSASLAEMTTRLVLFNKSVTSDKSYNRLISLLFTLMKENIVADVVDLNSNLETGEAEKAGTQEESQIFLKQLPFNTKGVFLPRYTKDEKFPASGRVQLIHKILNVEPKLREHFLMDFGIKSMPSDITCSCHGLRKSQALICSFCLEVFCEEKSNSANCPSCQ